MANEVNTTNFANQLNYSVEEISLDEFLAAIRQTNKDEENAGYISSIEEKVNQSREAA